MATINVEGGQDYTGTTADDIFNNSENAAGQTLAAGEGADTLNFEDALAAGTGVASSVTLASGGTVTISDAETLTFTNGTIDLTNEDDLQYLTEDDGDMDPDTFNGDTVLVYDPDTGNVTSETATVTSINGEEIEDGEAVQIGSQGTVTRSGTSLEFTPFTSYAQSLGLGETGTVSFDVTFDVAGEAVTVTYETSVEGEASDDADVYRTSNIEGDQDEAIDGLGGDDILSGDEGADTIYGNDGDDRIFAGSEDDGVNGSGNDDGDADDGDGNDLNNFSDAFAGGAGNDSIAGGDGDDILTGDDDSRVSTADGVAAFDASRDGSDTIFGGDGNDEIHTGSWNDADQGGGDAHTGSADDVAYGGEGNDTIRGAGGDDTLGGGNGDDDIAAGSGSDVIYGGSDDGADTLLGNAGNDTIFGGDGVDDVQGGIDDDVLYNGGGEDVVSGGSGQDTLWGGEGDDELTGNADSDVFAFVEGNGVDTITDFEDGIDQIDLSELGMTADDLPSMIGAIGGETAVFYGDGDAIIVAGVAAEDLTADDFIF